MTYGRMASINRYSAVCALLALALAGCSGQTIAQRKAETDAKRAAPTAVVMKNSDGNGDAPMATYSDGYPSFNGPLTAANVQINDQQAKDMQARLTALGAARKAGTITQAQYDAKVAAMRKLAADQQITLQEIQK